MDERARGREGEGRGKMDERAREEGRERTKKIKSVGDLKVYQKAYAWAMEIFQLSKYWIYVWRNAKQTEKILAPQNRLLISDL